MKQRHAHAPRSLTLAGLALAAAWSLPAVAGEAEAQRIVDALRPVPAAAAAAAAPGEAGANGPAIRTRGLRNLRVETGPGQADAAAAAAAVAPAAPTEPRSISLTIGFEFDSAQITPTSADTLASLAQALKSPDLQALNFRVEGHTDRRGKSDYNLRLSQQRADAVRTYLQKLGVPTDRLVAEGRGDTDLANPADPLASENRRVRIVTLSR